MIAAGARPLKCAGMATRHLARHMKQMVFGRNASRVRRRNGVANFIGVIGWRRCIETEIALPRRWYCERIFIASRLDRTKL